MCSRTLVTRTLKGDEKEFEFAGNSNYEGKFQRNFDQGKGNLVRVSGEFELSEFELSRFYCILLFLSGCALFFHNYFLLMSFALFVSRAQERLLLLLLYFLHQAETFSILN